MSPQEAAGIAKLLHDMRSYMRCEYSSSLRPHYNFIMKKVEATIKELSKT